MKYYSLWLKHLHKGLLLFIAKLFYKSCRDHHTLNEALTGDLHWSLMKCLFQKKMFLLGPYYHIKINFLGSSWKYRLMIATSKYETFFLRQRKWGEKRRLLIKAINSFCKDQMIHSSYFFNICLMSGGIFLHFHKLFPNLDISRSRYLTSKQLYEAMKFMCEVLQWLDRTAKKYYTGSLPSIGQRGKCL